LWPHRLRLTGPPALGGASQPKASYKKPNGFGRQAMPQAWVIWVMPVAMPVSMTEMT